MARLRDLIKDKNFSLLWLSQIISNFGDKLSQMALIGLVYSRTPGSPIELAKILSFTIIPVFIIGPVAGIYVDRWNRKYTMVACDLIRGILVLLIPLMILFSRGMVPIYILVLIIFSVTRFFVSSKLSIIPDIVNKEKLLLANSLTSTTMMIATIVGFGFGGLIVARLGAEGGFYVDSATYFISGLMVSFVALKINRNKNVPASDEKIKAVLKRTLILDIREGLSYLKGNKDIRLVANTLFLMMAGVGSIYVIIIVFIQQALGSSTEHLGILAMLLGAGLFLGSVAYGKFGTNLCKRKVINIGLCITGLIIVFMAVMLRFYPSFVMTAVISVVLGIFASPIGVSANTLLHEVMPDDMRGRIFSSLEIIMHMGFLIFMVLTSLIAEYVPKDIVLIFVGVIFSAIGLIKSMKP
jgi:MFS transporter, DHA3 family, macrolide efflux protein